MAALGRLLQQRGGARRVRCNTPAGVAHQRERDLSVTVALSRGPLVPSGGDFQVGRDTEPIFKNDTETEFRPGMAALGREHIPPPRLGELTINADAACIQKPELRLSLDKALFRRLLAPAECFRRLRLDRKAVRENQVAISLGEILANRRRGTVPPRNSEIRAALQIGEAQLVLCLSMPLLGRAPQPCHSIAEAGDDPLTAQMHQAQPIRAFGLAGNGRPPKEPEGLHEIARGTGHHPPAHGPARPARPGRADLTVHASPR